MRPLAPERAGSGVAAVLRDGTPVSFRPLRSTDAPALSAFFAALSPDARRTRFFTPTPEVGPTMLRHLVEVDQVTHVAWGAFVGDRCVGEVRAVRSRSDPSEAELAFAVADDLRRLGLGRLLVETIGVVARGSGIDRFAAWVLSDNRASGAMLSGLGMRFRFEDGARLGVGPVPAWRGSADAARRIGHLATVAACRELAPVA